MIWELREGYSAAVVELWPTKMMLTCFWDRDIIKLGIKRCFWNCLCLCVQRLSRLLILKWARSEILRSYYTFNLGIKRPKRSAKLAWTPFFMFFISYSEEDSMFFGAIMNIPWVLWRSFLRMLKTIEFSLSILFMESGDTNSTSG